MCCKRVREECDTLPAGAQLWRLQFFSLMCPLALSLSNENVRTLSEYLYKAFKLRSNSMS